MPSQLKKSFAAELLEKRRKKRPSAILVIAVIVAVIAVGYALYMRFGIKEIPTETVAPPEETQIRSVAVLPLDNLTGNPEQEYFCDGMHEALIANLSKIGALRVISRTSAMRFRNSEKSLPEIAAELGVDALIEGSVFRADGTVRITVQLIRAVPEQHLWANDYVRKLQDVIMLQKDVAMAIADEIEITVTSEEKERLSSTHTVNPEAYELYMMGMHSGRRGSAKKALDYFLQAVEKDSGFAAAYAEIAFVRAYRGRGGENPLKPYTEAKKALEKALELDDTQPAAYTAQGMLSMHYEWDWRTAEDNFKKAIDIDPSYMYSYAEIDNLLMLLGKEHEALELQRKALEIDPLSLEVMSDNMMLLGYLGDYEEALQLHQKIVEIDSKWNLSSQNVGFIYAAQGKYEEAIAAFTKLAQLNGSSGPNANIGYVYALMGKRAEAEKILAEILENGGSGFSIRLGLKDFDPIFEMLANRYNERSPLLVQLLVNYKRRSKDIVSDPRWKALMKKMGLPE